MLFWSRFKYSNSNFLCGRHCINTCSNIDILRINICAPICVCLLLCMLHISSGIWEPNTSARNPHDKNHHPTCAQTEDRRHGNVVTYLYLVCIFYTFARHTARLESGLWMIYATHNGIFVVPKDRCTCLGMAFVVASFVSLSYACIFELHYDRRPHPYIVQYQLCTIAGLLVHVM